MLQQQGLQDGRILGITSIMDLNHVESSYLVDFDEEIIYSIAHVPMPNPQSYLAIVVVLMIWIGRCACARYRLNQGFRIVEGLQVPPNESISFQQLQRQNDLNEENDRSRTRESNLTRVLDSTGKQLLPGSQRVTKALQTSDFGLLPNDRRALTSHPKEASPEPDSGLDDPDPDS